MALTEDKFNQGMTPQEYIDQIKVNKQTILDIYNTIKYPTQPRPSSMAGPSPFGWQCSPQIGAVTRSAPPR